MMEVGHAFMIGFGKSNGEVAVALGGPPKGLAPNPHYLATGSVFQGGHQKKDRQDGAAGHILMFLKARLRGGLGLTAGVTGSPPAHFSAPAH